MRIGILMPSRAERDVMFQKMTEAFDLLARYGPRRLARFRNDVAGVSIEMTVSGCGEWVSAVRRIRLDFDYVKAMETTPLEIAAALAHEGWHARLDRAGFGYREADRRRIEAACFRSEISFLRRVPGSEALIEGVERLLALDSQYWTDAAFLDRQVERLRQVRIPEFLIRRIVGKYPTGITSLPERSSPRVQAKV